MRIAKLFNTEDTEDTKVRNLYVQDCSFVTFVSFVLKGVASEQPGCSSLRD